MCSKLSQSTYPITRICFQQGPNSDKNSQCLTLLSVCSQIKQWQFQLLVDFLIKHLLKVGPSQNNCIMLPRPYAWTGLDHAKKLMVNCCMRFASGSGHTSSSFKISGNPNWVRDLIGTRPMLLRYKAQLRNIEHSSVMSCGTLLFLQRQACIRACFK